VRSNAASVVERLSAIVADLRSAAVSLRNHQQVYHSLMKAADQVGKSASGGWLGYHARIYKRGFAQVRPGEYWDTEWGTLDAVSNQTHGDWCEYTYEQVVEYIEQLAGSPDVDTADAAVRVTGNIFDRSRDSASAILAAVSEGDTFLAKVNERIEAVEKRLSPTAIVGALDNTTTHASRDARAANAGIQLLADAATTLVPRRNNEVGDVTRREARALGPAPCRSATRQSRARRSAPGSTRRAL
jgi:hypothetical protein